jgi:hypothetical protein
MADEIVAGQRIETAEEGRRFASAWIVTAAQHATNEEYYRGERDRLLRVVECAYNLLRDSSVPDVEFEIGVHHATLPGVLRRMAAGHYSALETLQAVVRDHVEILKSA